MQDRLKPFLSGAYREQREDRSLCGGGGGGGSGGVNLSGVSNYP